MPAEAADTGPDLAIEQETVSEKGPEDAELAAEAGDVPVDRQNAGGVMGATDESSKNAANEGTSPDEEQNGTEEAALPADLVAEAADAGSIPLEAALSHLPKEGSLPFLEQRLQAGQQQGAGEAEEGAPPAEEGAEQTPGSTAEDGGDAGPGEALAGAPKSVEELLEEERTRRVEAEAQLEGLRKQLQEAQEQVRRYKKL